MLPLRPAETNNAQSVRRPPRFVHYARGEIRQPTARFALCRSRVGATPRSQRRDAVRSRVRWVGGWQSSRERGGLPHCAESLNLCGRTILGRSSAVRRGLIAGPHPASFYVVEQRVWIPISRLASVYGAVTGTVAAVTGTLAVAGYLEGAVQGVQALLESSVTTIGWILIVNLALVLALALWLLMESDTLILAALAIFAWVGHEFFHNVWGVYEFLYRVGIKSVPSGVAQTVGWVGLGFIATLLCGGLGLMLAILLTTGGKSCPECGQRLPDGANYCFACGHSAAKPLGREASAS